MDTVERIGELAASHIVPSAKRSQLPILFVHGAWGGKWQFEKWQQYCAERGWESYALDLRGHGDSEGRLRGTSIKDYADDIVHAMEKIGPCHLLGHSMGGLIVQLAAAYSSSVKKLILLASAASRSPYLNAYVLRMSTYVPAALAQGIVIPRTDDIEHFFGPIQDDAKGKFVAESTRACADIIFSISPSVMKCPTLVVAGDRDLLIPLYIERKLASRYSCDLMQFDMGHFLMLEPGCEKVIEKITDWLAND